jgi:hypothetical protein
METQGATTRKQPTNVFAVLAEHFVVAHPGA